MVTMQTEMVASLEPYWGAPTASIDWCESNYIYSRFVAEWFNALSSLATIAVALCGHLLHPPLLERRLSLAFGLVGLVGVGSFAFHATVQMEQ